MERLALRETAQSHQAAAKQTMSPERNCSIF
jgi:hypothetical protein